MGSAGQLVLQLVLLHCVPMVHKTPTAARSNGYKLWRIIKKAILVVQSASTLLADLAADTDPPPLLSRSWGQCRVAAGERRHLGLVCRQVDGRSADALTSTCFGARRRQAASGRLDFTSNLPCKSQDGVLCVVLHLSPPSLRVKERNDGAAG